MSVKSTEEGGGRFRRRREKLKKNKFSRLPPPTAFNRDARPLGLRKPRWPPVPACPGDHTKKEWTVNSLLSNEVFFVPCDCLARKGLLLLVAVTT